VLCLINCALRKNEVGQHKKTDVIRLKKIEKTAFSGSTVDLLHILNRNEPFIILEILYKYVYRPVSWYKSGAVWLQNSVGGCVYECKHFPGHYWWLKYRSKTLDVQALNTAIFIAQCRHVCQECAFLCYKCALVIKHFMFRHCFNCF